MEFAKFCNICFKEDNILNISKEENTALLNTLITLIGQSEMVRENSVYLCLYCFNKLEEINEFRVMCIANFVHVRQSCHDLKRELKNCNDPDINGKMKIFIDCKVKKQNSYVENSTLEDINSTEKDDKEIELEPVFIKEEPKDVRPEPETADYNIHNHMNSEPEGFVKKYKLESEIDLGISSYPEGEPNLVTPNLNVNNNISVAVKNASKEEISNDKSPVIPRRRGRGKNGETENYICEICKKSFQKLYNLMRHQLIHTGEKPYRCNLCNKTFNDSSYFKKHQRQHTGEKPYECDICKKSFNDLSNANRHRLIHTDEKPHECDICHKSFNAVSFLNRHRLIHGGEKPHRCNLCKKTFHKSSYLKIHRLFHTGEKPHECDICKKTFAVTSNLNRHRLIHTRYKSSK